jgi:hypothetical protein
MVLRSTIKARAKAQAKYSLGYGDGNGELPSPEERAAAAVLRIHSLIEDGEIPVALTEYDKAARTYYNWPSQPDLYALIKALHAQGAERESIRMMRDHFRHYPRSAPKMGVKLAQVLIRDCQRPVAALRVLEEIPPASLPADLEKARQRLARQAKELLEEGVVELEGDD